ncbi:uncharacterized protein [Rutidosis leptorrhynchoides]|uniref:uncharacterized protein n=1 Tax=Rutidosis leptorrhynchoides TaxID=125765 RepID=UPI003A993DD9
MRLSTLLRAQPCGLGLNRTVEVSATRVSSGQFLTGMVDQTRNNDAPVTPGPGIFRAPSVEHSPKRDPDEYVQQLEGQLQETREKVKELEAQIRHSTIVSEASDPPIPPGFTGTQYVRWQVVKEKKCTFKQFMDCKPSEYSGHRDPIVTMNWLREVERALKACQCEPELRVTYASQLLKNRAMVWWDTITTPLSEEQLNQVTWEQFFAKFMDKLRFVHQWIPDEQSRVQRFVEILRPEYRTIARLATTFSQAHMLAKITESDIKAARMGHEPQDCSFKNNVCWNCHKEGHRSAECPAARKSYSGAWYGSGCKNPPPPEARAFQMLVDTATATDDAITGMFLVNSMPVRVLFDCGANRSFVSTTFCAKLNVPVRVINEPLSVKVGDGRTVSVTNARHELAYDHNSSIKCDRKIISFSVAGGKRVVARGDRGRFRCPLLSMMKVQKSLAKGCGSFLAYVIDVKKEKKVVSDILVVSEYPEVFPDELPALPPIREIEYKIELVPGATPVAKAPYRLTPSEICEMMSQIQELLDRGFIRPSS